MKKFLKKPPSRRLLSLLGHPLFLGVLAATCVTQLRASRTYEVAKPSENIRTAPEGRHIGTLLQGATIEEAGRDGRWVKFELEAWIWGPSLEGFEALEGFEEILEAPEDPATSTADRRSTATSERRPRVAVSAHLDEVRELIDADFGRFYGMRRDPDLEQLQIRFRVTAIDSGALERRHMRVQHRVLELLAGDVAFHSIRTETNRADGSGEVGVVQWVTSVEDIGRFEGKDISQWRHVSRRSADGGKSWVDGKDWVDGGNTSSAPE